MILEPCGENGKQLWVGFIIGFWDWAGDDREENEHSLGVKYVSNTHLMCITSFSHTVHWDSVQVHVAPALAMLLSLPSKIKSLPVLIQWTKKTGLWILIHLQSLTSSMTLGDLSDALSPPAFSLSFLYILFGQIPLRSALDDPNPFVSWSCFSRSPDHVCC